MNLHISSERLPELIVERLEVIRVQRASRIDRATSKEQRIERVSAASRH
jgi:hypothetical protein